jgi:hypothetical protein
MAAYTYSQILLRLIIMSPPRRTEHPCPVPSRPQPSCATPLPPLPDSSTCICFQLLLCFDRDTLHYWCKILEADEGQPAVSEEDHEQLRNGPGWERWKACTPGDTLSISIYPQHLARYVCAHVEPSILEDVVCFLVTLHLEQTELCSRVR